MPSPTVSGGLTRVVCLANLLDCYSKKFEKNSTHVQSELYFINQVAGRIVEPTYEDIKKYSEKYGFPIGADKDVLSIAYTYGMHFLPQGETKAARYYLSIFYELTQDNEIKNLLNLISTLEEGD